jgi:hypothetical protein
MAGIDHPNQMANQAGGDPSKKMRPEFAGAALVERCRK